MYRTPPKAASQGVDPNATVVYQPNKEATNATPAFSAFEPPANIARGDNNDPLANIFLPPSGKLGAVTRKSNEIKALLDSGCKADDMLSELYSQYNGKVKALEDACTNMPSTVEVRSKMRKWYDEHSADIVSFKIEFENYMKELKEQRKAPLSVKSSEKAATSSVHSKSTTSSARFKLAEKKAKLAAEKEYAEKMAALDKQELEHRNKVRQAELEKIATEHRLMEQEISKLDDLADRLKDMGRSSQAGLSFNETHRAPPNNGESSGLGKQLVDVLDRQTQLTLSIAQHQQKAELPKREIPVFDGSDPTQYRSFMNNFERTISSKCENSADCLYYLQQFTAGVALKIVQSCDQYDAAKGYEQAMRMLNSEFGNEHKTATAYLEALENWPPVKSEDGKAMQELALFLQACSNNMGNMAILNQLNSPKEIMKVVMKLPYEMRKQWRNKSLHLLEQRCLVSFADLVSFVDLQSRLVNMPVYGSISDKSPKSTSNKQQPQKKSFSTKLDNDETAPRYSKEMQIGNTVTKYFCHYCKKGNHNLQSCYFFRKLKYDDKVSFIKKGSLCFGCLQRGHTSRGCVQRHTCDTCARKHPTVLHRPAKVSEEKLPVVTKTPIIQTSTSCTTKYTGHHTNVIMCSVLPVQIKVSGKQNVITYAVLDSCSSACFLDESLLSSLGISGKASKISLSTIEACYAESATRIVNNLEVSDMNGNLQDIIPVVYTRKQWPFSLDDTPKYSDELVQQFKNLPIPLVDSNIGLIIGMNRPDMLKPLEIIDGQTTASYASRHRLGWALNGPVQRKTDKHVANKISVKDVEVLENQISDIFDRDYRDHYSQQKVSQDDIKWQHIMEESIELTNNCHYSVNLPIKEQVDLPNNRGQVFHGFQSLLHKLEANSTLYNDYKDFMNMMLEKGFAEKVPSDELLHNNAWYLMHHAVYHKTKGNIRVVFNCSLRNKGVSLNDALYQGPDLTNNLLGVLLRFRQESIAITGDIEKMFYQVKVPPSHRNFLRFFWLSDDLYSKPVEYRLTVHVFGAKSSPSVANFALRQTVHDNDNYSKPAMAAVLRSFYVDDLLHSVPNEEIALSLVTEIKDLLAKGGFPLTKFTSNSASLVLKLREIGMESNANEKSIVPYPDRALGLIWNTEADTLHIKINKTEKPHTRRGMLSVIHSTYDPFGLVGPALVPAKQLFQETCRLQLGWDDLLPPSIAQKWENWLSELELLENFEIPRCCKPCSVVETELHFFSDGSETAYASVAYIRFISEIGLIHCVPLLAKVRLNPLCNNTFKTIPRIELNAAKLSIILQQILREELDYSIDSYYYWTDSTTVLKYIHSEETRFVRFVSNRIAFIRSHSEKSQWKYVPSGSNPADCISRGVSISRFLNLNLWKAGPSFLRSTEETWPPQPVLEKLSVQDLEIKKTTVKCSTLKATVLDPTKTLLHSTHDWYKLKCRVAWMLRLKAVLRGESVQTGHLTLSEIKKAELAIFKRLQQEHFSEAILRLDNGNNLLRGDPLRKLNPFIDDRGLLRVGGRLHHASMSYENKHPIILSSKCAVVATLVNAIHKVLGHLGRETMVASLKRTYWIIGLNALIRNVLYSCVTCRKLNGQPYNQKMASLPSDRVTTDEPAFTRVGLDFFGPFEVINGRKHEKRYGVVFTCLSSRAIHLEMVYSLSTDSFINAFRRFLARRGNVKVVRSDNGTNIIGGKNELKKAIADWNKSTTVDWMLQRNIEWKQQPPSASHFGGVFEREIRSVRKVLGAILNEQPLKLNDEHLNTLLCEVESILNCRPLVAASQGIDDFEALTPNHLLLLHEGATFPPGLFSKTDMYVTRRWKQVQFLANLFWSRFRKEYLPILQERQKWFNHGYQYKEGDLVLLTDQMLPRNQWSLGRITEVYPAADNIVRVVKLRVSKYKDNKNGKPSNVVELERPVTKLILVQPSEG